MSHGTPLHQQTVTPIGGQPPFDPADLEEFVAAPRVAVLAYVRNDGRPNQIPIWYTERGGTFFMVTSTSSAKRHAIAENPHISLTIDDDRPPYRAIIIDGTAALSELDPADDPTEGVATRYFGKVMGERYERSTAHLAESGGLTLITLVPDEIRGFDNTKSLSSAAMAFARVRALLPIPRRLL